jgi:hypothetical protein
MSWVKVDDQFPRHSKVQAAGGEMVPNGVGRVMAVWLEGACYAAEQLTDGFVPRGIVEKMVSDQKPLQVVGLLVKHRLWHEAAGGYQIHDWQHYNPPAEKVRKQRADKAEKQRQWRATRAAEREERRRLRGEERSTECSPERDAERSAERGEEQAASRSALPHARAWYPSPSPSPFPSLHPSDGSCVSPLPPTAPGPSYGPPLAMKTRVDVAWPGRPNVPGALHLEFVSKLGGDPDDADGHLRRWYPTVAAKFEGQPIGDDDFRFWRARFREWVGTTVSQVSERRAEQAAYEPEDDWFDECQRLHDGECNGKLGHRTRMQVEAARQPRAAAR